MGFPIVKIDRTITHKYLTLFMNKGIFSNYKTLPKKVELLEIAKKDLGVDELTPIQKREILTLAGEYKTQNYVVKDYGNYIIAFSARMFLESLESAEEELALGISNDYHVDEALKRIKLYKLGHKIAFAILSEAYHQRKYDDFVIPKQKLLYYLDYETNEKNIYSDIRTALFSLRWLDYKIFEYKNSVEVKPKSTQIGNFLYDIKEDGNNYTLGINKNFAGGVAYLLTDGKKDNSVFGGWLL